MPWQTSGQISIIPKPELRGFWGSSLIKPPFRVTSADVVIICPETSYSKDFLLECILPETNMAPENVPPVKGDSHWKHSLSGAMSMLVSGSVLPGSMGLVYLPTFMDPIPKHPMVYFPTFMDPWEFMGDFPTGCLWDQCR